MKCCHCGNIIGTPELHNEKLAEKEILSKLPSRNKFKKNYDNDISLCPKCSNSLEIKTSKKWVIFHIAGFGVLTILNSLLHYIFVLIVGFLLFVIGVLLQIYPSYYKKCKKCSFKCTYIP